MSLLDRSAGRREPRSDRGPSWVWRASICVALAVASSAPAHADEFELRIGVMSPLEDTPSREAGTAHQNTIRVVFPDGPLVRHVAGHQLKIVPLYRNDGGTTASCQLVARELVEEQRVVAILGPVDSDCTRAVLAAGLDVPVVSSLSTATFLTVDRDRWFFRATLDDRARVKRYLDFLRKYDDSLAWSESLILFDAENGYASGLAQDLERELGPGVHRVAWSDLGALGALGALASSGPGAILPVFSLGGTRRAVEIVREIEGVSGEGLPPGSLRFFLMGAFSESTKAPIGTFTIGEPGLDPKDLPLLSKKLARAIEELEGSFVFPAYEAANFVLVPAIENAAENLLAVGRRPSDAIAELREEVREEIEGETFDSLTPPRTIRFENGNLANPLAAPIYRVAASLERLDSPPERPWVEIEVESTVQLFEKPIVIRLTGHSMGPSDPVLLHIERGRGSDVHSETVTLQGGRAETTYHPSRPGKYRVRADVSHAPRNATVKVEVGLGYLVAILFATAGSFLAGRSRPTRLLEGVVTGLLLTWLTSYVRALPLSLPLPIPSLSEAPSINAALSGLLGGWMGPSILGKLMPGPKPPR